MKIDNEEVMRIESFVIKNPNYDKFNTGWGNGYAVLPKGHPCYGMDYDEIHRNYDIDVHGGLTFSRSGQDCISFFPTEFGSIDFWIVGFDTRHLGDTPAKWPEKRVEEHAAKLAFRFFEIWIEQERNKTKK